MAIAVSVLGKPLGLDPALLLPLAVLGGAAVGGTSSGLLAAVIGGAYVVLYYSQPGAPQVANGVARVVTSLVAGGLTLWVANLLIERGRAEQAAAVAAARRSSVVTEFAARLTGTTPADLAATVVDGAVGLLGANMGVLTVLDPQSGRYFVRASYGTGSSAVGVEVVPGVGITGQAIRDRRTIVSRGLDTASVLGLNRRLRGRSGTQSMAAVAAVRTDRVIASLTVGRADGTPFSADDQRLLEGIGYLVALAVASETR